MYGGDAKPNLEALAAAGLKLEEPLEDDAVECYPDNWQALRLFSALGTQWRVAERGFVLGLHYETVPGVMDMLGIKHKYRERTFADLRTMEEEVLPLFRKKQG